MSNYFLSPDSKQVDLTGLNSIDNNKIYLQDEARTQSGNLVIQTFGGNKKSITLGFAPTTAFNVRKVENLLDSCPGFTLTLWLDYLQGSISCTAKFTSKKVLAGTDLFTYTIEVSEV